MIPIHNPVTREEIARVPVATAEQVRAAVERARAVQPAWAALPVAVRARYIRRIGDAMYRQRAEILRTIIQETAKVETDAWYEVIYNLGQSRFWSKAGPRLLRPRRVPVPLYAGFPKRATTYWRPHGVVGSIGAWNFPWQWPGTDTIPALLAGNAVVFKPSEFTPLCGLLAQRLVSEAGVPDGVFQVVTGYADTGSALVDAVDMVTFTGSTVVGRRILEQASRRMIPVLLEMGGKDPFIVLQDANVDRAAHAAVFGGLLHAGQACLSVERVYVEAPVYDAFLARVLSLVKEVRTGPGPDTQIGPLLSQAQLAKVEEHIKDAVDKGARVLAGGGRLENGGGLYYTPTVLADVDHGMKVMQQETFGPILPIMKVQDEAEALRLANDSDMGLTASVWTRSMARGRRLGMQLDVGTANVNDLLAHFHVPGLPMGGAKTSSYGYRHAPESIYQFVRPQVLYESPIGLKYELTWFFYHRYGPALARLIVRLWFGWGPGRWFR